MKKLFKTFFFLAALWLILCFCGFTIQALAFTYESEISPDEFNKWIPIQVIPINPMAIMAVVQNPDPTAEIKQATLIVHINGSLLAYGYLKDGIEYHFTYDPDSDCYVQTRPVVKSI